MFLSVVRRWRLAEEAPHICKQWSLCRRTKSSVWIEKVCFIDDCLTKINESVKMLPLGQSNPTFGNQVLGTCSYTLGKLFTSELWLFSWFFWFWKDCAILASNFLRVGLRHYPDTHFIQIRSRISTLVKSIHFIKIWPLKIKIFNRLLQFYHILWKPWNITPPPLKI